MPSVVLGRDLARRYTAGQTRIELDSSVNNVRAVIRALDAQHPGIGIALRTDMATAIDGQIYQDALLEPVNADSEVCFMPAIEAG